MRLRERAAKVNCAVVHATQPSEVPDVMSEGTFGGADVVTTSDTAAPSHASLWMRERNECETHVH